MKGPFDIAKDLTSKKTPWNEEIEKSWNTYMVNRTLSMNENNIDFIDMVQRYFNIPIQNVHELYRTLLPVDSRFYPYLKTEGTLSKDIKLVCLHYDLSKQDARDYLNIISKEELDDLRQKDDPEQFTTKKIKSNRNVKR